VPESYTSRMAIDDTAIHEIDTMRWLPGEGSVKALHDDDDRVDEVVEAVSGRLGALHTHLDDLLTQEPAHRVARQRPGSPGPQPSP